MSSPSLDEFPFPQLPKPKNQSNQNNTPWKAEAGLNTDSTILIATGVNILPTQTMHSYKGIPSKLPNIYLHCLIPPKIGNLITPVQTTRHFFRHTEYTDRIYPPPTGCWLAGFTGGRSKIYPSFHLRYTDIPQHDGFFHKLHWVDQQLQSVAS